MFTQCSKCETIFRLSAEALRAAGGQVRCGRCGEVFNALARLAEDATGFTKGESPLDLETRAAEILEATDTHETLGLAASESAEDIDPSFGDAPPGVEIAHLQILDPLEDDPAAETSLEFTLPPGELDRIFIETRPGTLQELAAEGPRGELGEVWHDAPSPIHAEPAEPIDTELGHTELGYTEHDLAEYAHPESLHAVPSHAEPIPAERIPAVPTPAAPKSSARVAGLEVSEDVRQEMLASYSHAELPQINVLRRRLPFAAWVAAAILLGIVLAFQVIRSNRDWLAAHTPLLGGSATPAATLSSYQLRQWGVTGDPGAKGTLRVRASIMNAAAQLQPYPLLRVTLANRFGTRVGARDFEPAEYLGHATARMLAPGERADAILDILDPGKDAEGFEIDICVRGSDQKIHCASDAAARAL